MEIFSLLGLAALGGFFLNVTPCVLPVLSLKILSFIKTAKGSRFKAFLHGLLYFLGIVLSFLVLAGVTLIIQAATGAAIFGAHILGSALFNAALALIMGFLGLKLLGVCGVVAAWVRRRLKWKQSTKIGKLDKLKTWLSEKLMALKEKAPYIGSFLHGSLTTFIGSACCGPMLGYAVGLALGWNPIIVCLAFLAAGIGMGLPYLLLPLIPGFNRVVPKAGKWIVVVERICGVLMLFSALWFLWLAI